MKRLLSSFIVFHVTLCVYSTEVPLCHGTVMRFASQEEGEQILGTVDDFIRNLSPFDRQARRMSQSPVTEEEFLSFVAAQVREWSVRETADMTEIIERIGPQLQRMEIDLPEVIYLIKTTGLEEGNAQYTRQNAIILPKGRSPEPVLVHEIFHVFSRYNPTVRDELYAIIGFKPCGMPIPYPDNLAPIKITNPDAPVTEHYITVGYGEDIFDVAPVLYSNTDSYNGGSFFNYLVSGFMAIEGSDDAWTYQLFEDGPLILLPGYLTDFYEQIGSNTSYIIHPDEIMADNFVFLVDGAVGHVRTPGIIEEMSMLFNVELDSPVIAVQPLDHLGENGVASMALSPDGTRVLLTNWDKTAKILDVETGQEIQVFEYTHRVLATEFSPDGTLILTGSDDNTARLWDAETGTEIASFAHANRVISVAFSPDGSLALTGSTDKKAKLWDVASGEELFSVRHASSVNSVAFSPDGSQFLTGSHDKMARLWDTATGEKIHIFRHGHPLQSVAFSPDGTLIVTGGGEAVWGATILGYGTATLWDIASGEQISVFEGHVYPVTSVAFSSFGSHILTGSSDGTASLWEVASRDELRIFRESGITYSVSRVAFMPGDGRILTSGYTGARLWDITDLMPMTSGILDKEWLLY